MQIFLEELDRTRRLRNCPIYGYVIMPEHVHLILHPEKDSKIGSLIGEIKSRSAKRIFEHMHDTGQTVPASLLMTRHGIQKRVFWQARFYDHNCRTQESVIRKIEYCHKNPVNRSLVDHPAKWRWSSYGWYQGERDVPLAIDELVVTV